MLPEGHVSKEAFGYQIPILQEEDSLAKKQISKRVEMEKSCICLSRNLLLSM